MAFFAGHMSLSFYFNPMGPLVGFASVVVWLMSFVKKNFSFEKLLRSIPRTVWRPALIVILAWGVLRN